MQDKLLELEMKDRENKTMLQYLEHLCEEELKGKDKIALDKKQLREELDKCLADNVSRRAAAKEADKLLTETAKKQRQEEDVSSLYDNIDLG